MGTGLVRSVEFVDFCLKRALDVNTDYDPEEPQTGASIGRFDGSSTRALNPGVPGGIRRRYAG